jgi:uncharacterized protein YjiS (DUF1127 family)
MTDIKMTLRPHLPLARRLRLWLAPRRRRRAPAAHLDTLSDHMRRDIGSPRDELDRMAIRTLHDAMRYSG